MSDRLARLANRCILPGFAGLTAPDWLRRELDEGLGGVVLFGRNVRDREQLAELARTIRTTPETVIAIPVIVFFLLVQRKIAFGLTAGAVKA